ncbi:retropepsin-like aspartic protease family protein [Marichromatium bheemlicum]|uniref:TIGR02281 family clan AA aspartic protease n=1 Tax=Marichromatium bheemlicum TaxID=365339 RepID=A0ABX1I9B8_9GAMM|nr:TIGR02281 family clan AA aspartic protease [Marichromatium bheemlicum]NKN33873.1 TIGR02281 family clan AA aspartic protease [Marichromatium bheemlicum]
MSRADEQPQRIGRVMLLAAWVVALGLLALLFGGLLEHDRAPPPRLFVDSDGTPGVVLERNRAGHYVADGRIDGEPVRFLVDTGATAVALPLALAQRLGLELRPGGISRTANGEVRVWRTRLARVELGGLIAHDVRAAVLPNMSGNEVLLGMSFLGRLELVQRGETLTLRPPPG